jgi:hypothetical protein
MSAKFSCPSCGAEVIFQSRLSIFGVCSFCRSMLVRRDVDIESIGMMAELPEDISPFQIGTSGKYEGKRFRLVGRLRMAWQDGGWNEWHALFEDGRTGWLAEAQGFLMMSFETESGLKSLSTAMLTPGSRVPINGHSVYQVDDVKNVICSGSEGELPFLAPHGRRSVSVDISGPDQAFGTLDHAEGEPVRVYLGRYVEFDDFQFTGLRKLDGWS